MDNGVNYLYHAKFEGNILVVGKTGCGKTTFIQSLGRNKTLGDIKEYQTISKISLSTERKNSIRDCFVDQKVDFEYPENIEDFDDLLDFWQRKVSPCNETCLEENVVLDRLIVMDNIFGLGDRSEAFSNILTVSKIWSNI